MENAMNITSEEELLQLRNEGNISESEYNDLLTAMRTPPPQDNEDAAPGMDKPKSKHKLGKTAFVLMLVGIILPAVLYWLAEMAAQAHDADMHSAIGPWFFLGVAFEIAAFVLGVIAWPDVFGKAAAITTSVLTVLTVILLALTL